MDKHAVSVIICTKDRSASMDRTFVSIFACSIPINLRIEVLVVDNGSTDNTKQITSRWQAGNLQMRLRYIHEPRPGKGYAYNAGLTSSTGAVLLFTDDDLLVPIDWVERMALPLLEGECDAIQGGVKMGAELRRSWMTDYHRACLADTDRPMTGPELIGANMAFHRRVLERVGGFDVNLGPGGLGFGDDSLLAKQILTAGFKIKDAA